MLRHFPRTAMAAMAAIVGLNLGCNGKTPVAPSPIASLTSIAPSTGPVTGAQRVTVVGKGFQPGATVTIGGTAVDVEVTGDISISATTIAHPEGRVDVIVTNPDGTTSNLRAAYQYFNHVRDLDPNLRTFTESGVSTTDVRDFKGNVVQFDKRGELIWAADGRRFPGFFSTAGSLFIDGVAASGNSFIVYFGGNEGESAYLTAVDGEGLNPGTLVVDGDRQIVGRTNVFPPGSYPLSGYTLSGVVAETTPGGLIPVAGAFVMLTYGAGNQYQSATTDRDGRFEIRRVYYYVKALNVSKEGNQFLSQPITITGDTTVDLQLLRR
jgi:hypothetical protein